MVSLKRNNKGEFQEAKGVRTRQSSFYKPGQNETFKIKQTNLLYDFYSTENNIGIYKKVAPQIDGSFQTSKSAVSFEIIKDNGDFILQFSSPWNTWVKKIKHLDSEKLVLFKEERNFHYRRPVISKLSIKNE